MVCQPLIKLLLTYLLTYCRTHAAIVRHTKYATPALEKLSELSPIFCSLILI